MTRPTLTLALAAALAACQTPPVPEQPYAESAHPRGPGHDACMERCYHTGSVGAATQPGYQPGDVPAASWCEWACREAEARR